MLKITEIKFRWEKKIRQINYLEISLDSKNLSFTKFLQKERMRVNFRNFPHCVPLFLVCAHFNSMKKFRENKLNMCVCVCGETENSESKIFS